MPPRQNRQTRSTGKYPRGDTPEIEERSPRSNEQDHSTADGLPTQGQPEAGSQGSPQSLTAGTTVNGNPATEATTLSEQSHLDGLTRPESPTYAVVTAGRQSPPLSASGLPPRQEDTEKPPTPQLRAMRCSDDQTNPSTRQDEATPGVAAPPRMLDPTPQEAASMALIARAAHVGGPLPLTQQSAVAEKAPPKTSQAKGKSKVPPRTKKRGAVGQGLPSSVAKAATVSAGPEVTQDRTASDARKRRRVTDDVEEGRAEPSTDNRVQNAESESFAQTARPAAGLFVYDDADALARPPPVTPPPVRRMPPNQPGWGPEDDYLVSYWRERESQNWQRFPSYPYPLPTATSTPARGQSGQAAVGIIPDCPWLTITPSAERREPLGAAAPTGWTPATGPQSMTETMPTAPQALDPDMSLGIDYNLPSAGSWHTVPMRGGTARNDEHIRPLTPEITAGMYAPLAPPPNDAMIVDDDEPLAHAEYHPTVPTHQHTPQPSLPRAPSPALVPLAPTPARRSIISGIRTPPTSCPPLRRPSSPSDQSTLTSHTRIPRFTRRTATDFTRPSNYIHASPKAASITEHFHRLDRLQQPPLGNTGHNSESMQQVAAGAPPPPPPGGGTTTTIVPAAPLPQDGHVNLHTPGLSITRAPREGWPRTELRTPLSWRDGQEEEQANAWGVEGGGVRVFVHFAGHGAQDLGTNDRIDAAYGVFIAEFNVDTNGIRLIPGLSRATGAHRANQSPTYLAVIGMAATTAARMASFGWISTSRVTMRVELLRDSPPNYLGAFLHVRRFGSMRNEDIAAHVQTIIREDTMVAGEIRAIIARDIAAGGRWREYPVDVVFTHILNSLTVSVMPLRMRGADAEPLARIYIEPPTANASEWLAFRSTIMGMRFGDVLAGHPVPFTGTLWCALCHSHDHPTSICTLPSIPGWNGPSLSYPTLRSHANQNERGGARGGRGGGGRGGRGGRGGGRGGGPAHLRDSDDNPRNNRRGGRDFDDSHHGDGAANGSAAASSSSAGGYW